MSTSTSPSCIPRRSRWPYAAGRRRGDGRRGVMTSSFTLPEATRPAGSSGGSAGRAAGRRRGVRGLRHRYELALLTLSASLNGGSIVATSLIVAGYIAALGAGALLVRRCWRARRSPSRRRGAAGHHRRPVRDGAVCGVRIPVTARRGCWAVSTALIGGLVGAEVPLLMTLLQRGGWRVRPTPAVRWPTSTRPITWARWSAGWSGRSSCCRSWG